MVQKGSEPCGQFDGYTGEGPVAWLGGEVAVLITDESVDANGYFNVFARPAKTGDIGPFYLTDDGTLGYGVIFGNTVMKTDTGFVSGSDAATRLGPASYAASGKVTLWDKPGLYAVTPDALSMTQGDLDAAKPGDSLTVTADGKLETSGALAGAVASVVSYHMNESLVTTGGAVVAHTKLVINFNPHGVLA